MQIFCQTRKNSGISLHIPFELQIILNKNTQYVSQQIIKVILCYQEHNLLQYTWPNFEIFQIENKNIKQSLKFKIDYVILTTCYLGIYLDHLLKNKN